MGGGQAEPVLAPLGGGSGVGTLSERKGGKKKREGKRKQRPRRNRGWRTPAAVDTGLGLYAPVRAPPQKLRWGRGHHSAGNGSGNGWANAWANGWGRSHAFSRHSHMHGLLSQESVMGRGLVLAAWVGWLIFGLRSPVGASADGSENGWAGVQNLKFSGYMTVCGLCMHE